MKSIYVQLLLVVGLCLQQSTSFCLRSSLSFKSRAPLLDWSRLSNFDTSLYVTTVTPAPVTSTKESSLHTDGDIAKPNEIAVLESVSASKKIEEESTDLVWKAVVFVIMTLWASNFPVIKMIYNELPNMDSSVYAGWRFGLAALTGVPFFFNQGSMKIYKEHPDKLADIFMKSFWVGLAVFIGYMGQAIGIMQGSSPENCAFIAALCIAWVPFITGVLKKDFSKNHWASTLMAISGVAFLELKGSHGMSAGDLWCFLQPLGFGSSYVLLEYFMNQKGKNEMQAISASTTNDDDKNNLSLNMITRSANDDVEIEGEDDLVSALQLAVVGILSIGYAFGTGHGMAEFLAVKDSPSSMALLAYTGFITTGFSVFLQTKAAKKVASTDFTIILAGEPIFAALFAALFLHENIGNQDIFGGLLVTIACIANEFDFVSFNKRRKN